MPRANPATEPAPPTTNADLLLQRRAVNVSLLGLAVQAGLVVAAFVLTLLGQFDAGGGVITFAAVGILVWGAVAVAAVFRRARTVEAFELEAASRSGESARTIFESEVDARPAARRLASIYRYVLPIVTIVVGLALALQALVMFRYVIRVAGTPIADPERIAGIAAGVSFVGFVAGYYLMGMAQSLRWPVLRAGATYLLGTVLLLALIAASAGAQSIGINAVTQVARYIIPAVLLIVGIELLLNLVLDLYRPKSAEEGEAAMRPGFDSRLLRLVASPGGAVRSLNEAVNYQFGFEITQSWFWKLLSRSFAWLVLFGVGVLVLSSSFVTVGEHERGLVTTFGRLHDEPLEPGLHVKWPWPITKVALLDVTRIRQLRVGTHPADHMDDVVLWDTQHEGLESELLIVAPTPERRLTGEGLAAEGIALNDTSTEEGERAPAVALAAADLDVQWRIAPDGVIEYVTTSANTSNRVAQLAESLLARQMSKHHIDAAIGPRRHDIATTIEQKLREAVQEENLGVEIVWVGLSGVMPPKAVAAQFNELAASEQDQLRLQQEGRAAAAAILAQTAGSVPQARRLAEQIADYNAGRSELNAEEVAQLTTQLEQFVQQAGGQAAEELLEARSERWTIENAARGAAGRVPAYRAAWDTAREYFMRRMHLQVLEETMAGQPKTIYVTDSPRHLNFEQSGGLDIAGIGGLEMPER